MDTLLSVIIPVYNVEKTLERCINSVINQTYTNLEIILVNDGSTDNSLQICEKFKYKDPRIKIVNKENGGLSSARNAGLDIMTGKYVAFLDSDDYIDESMYEDLLSCIDKYDVDTALCSTQRVLSDGTVIPILESIENHLFCNDEVIKDFLLGMFYNHDKISDKDYQYEMAVWRALYTADIIRKNNIRYISEREIVSEDILFDLDYFRYSKKVYYLNKHYHYYCDNSSSLTASYKDDSINRLFSLYNAIKNKFKLLDINNPYYADHLLLTRIRDLVHLCIFRNADLKSLLNEINTSDLVKKIYDSYPFKNLSFKQRVFYSFIRLNNSHLVSFLVKLNSKRG